MFQLFLQQIHTDYTSLYRKCEKLHILPILLNDILLQINHQQKLDYQFDHIRPESYLYFVIYFMSWGGHVFDMIGRLKANNNLLKKMRYFDFHQKTIQRFYLTGKKKRTHKRLSAKQLARIRRRLNEENREAVKNRIFVIIISVLLSLILIYLLSQVLLKHYL